MRRRKLYYCLDSRSTACHIALEEPAQNSSLSRYTWQEARTYAWTTASPPRLRSASGNANWRASHRSGSNPSSHCACLTDPLGCIGLRRRSSRRRRFSPASLVEQCVELGYRRTVERTLLNQSRSSLVLPPILPRVEHDQICRPKPRAPPQALSLSPPHPQASGGGARRRTPDIRPRLY